MSKILKFGAEWCKGCKELEELNKDYLKDAKVIDIDRSPQEVREWNITKIPTVIVLSDDGVEVTRVIGKTEIIDYFEN